MTNAENRNIDPPGGPLTDLATVATKTAIAAIAATQADPVLAASAGTLAAELVGSLFSRRTATWAAMMSDLVLELQGRLNKLPDEIFNDERFASAFLRSTQIAIREHQRDKLIALKNALESTALRPELHDDEVQRFIRYVDELGVSHLDILNRLVLSKPQLGEASDLGEVYKTLVTEACPGPDIWTFRTIMEDLRVRFLISFGDMDDIPELASQKVLLAVEKSAVKPVEVTPLGAAFLDFIKRDGT